MDPTDGNFLEGPVQPDLRCEEVRGEIFWPEEAQDYDVGGKEENSLANSAFADMSFLREIACGGGCFVKTDIMGNNGARTIRKVDRPTFEFVSVCRGGSKGGEEGIGNIRCKGGEEIMCVEEDLFHSVVVKILRLRMTKNVILVIFSVHCSEKIWIIVNFY